jgi:hypothetical protein
VAENTIFTGKEISFLRELQKQGVEFMIVGAAAAALQGAPVVTQDIDLWFKDLKDPGIKAALTKTGGAFVPTVGMRPPTFAGGAVELFDVVLTMHGLGPFDEEKKHSILVDLGRLSVRILALERIIKSKETVDRPKDRLTLPVLRDALAAIEKKKALRRSRQGRPRPIPRRS